VTQDFDFKSKWKKFTCQHYHNRDKHYKKAGNIP
jgi:hypothetical protein